MAGIPAAHFSHPKHELKQRESYHLSHTCDLCGEKLAGSGYSCPRRFCSFHLHEECARYPETLRSFFAHPWHRLTLARTTDGQRVCNLCREEVPAGVFRYSCAPCGFDVHPPCSRLPRTASSEVHPEHELGLTAMPSAGAPCAACPEPCNVWVYRCGQCDVHLHIECLHDDTARGRNEEQEEEGSSSSLLGQVMGGVQAWNSVVEITNSVAEIKDTATNLFS